MGSGLELSGRRQGRHRVPGRDQPRADPDASTGVLIVGGDPRRLAIAASIEARSTRANAYLPAAPSTASRTRSRCSTSRIASSWSTARSASCSAARVGGAIIGAPVRRSCSTQCARQRACSTSANETRDDAAPALARVSPRARRHARACARGTGRYLRVDRAQDRRARHRVADRRRHRRRAARRGAAARARARRGRERREERVPASMSHELRTPLNAILGFAQLLAARQEGAAERAPAGAARARPARRRAPAAPDRRRARSVARSRRAGVTISPEPVDAAEVLAEVVTRPSSRWRARAGDRDRAARGGRRSPGGGRGSHAPRADPDELRLERDQVRPARWPRDVPRSRGAPRRSGSRSSTTGIGIPADKQRQALRAVPARRAGDGPDRGHRHRPRDQQAARRADAGPRRLRERARARLGVLGRDPRPRRSVPPCPARRRWCRGESRLASGATTPQGRLHRGQPVEHRVHARADRRTSTASSW